MVISKENMWRQYIQLSLDDRVFSGAAVGFSKLSSSGEFETIVEYAGYTGSIGKEFSVQKNVFFDLASLTKPLVTCLCFFYLLDRGIVDWKEKISSLLSRNVLGDKKEINLFQLLTHSAGLPAYRDYYNKLENLEYPVAREKIVDFILNDSLEYQPGTKTIYSDLGYILLGHIVEKKTGFPLDLFWMDKICRPLNLQNKLFFPQYGDLDIHNCVATSFDPTTSKPLCGTVNDDNCRIMGGVAGHAGLFGTLEGVLFLCQELLKQYLNLCTFKAYSNPLLRKALSKQTHSSWVSGFDTPTPQHSTAGKYFSEQSVGHLGFTGTSFWIDLEKKVVAVVLTNRIFMGTSKEKMNMFRRTIHDYLMKKNRKNL